MKTYHYYENPVTVFGVPFFRERQAMGDVSLRRLPDEVIEAVPSLRFFGKRCPGARVEFRTNAAEFTLTMTLETLTMDVGMSVFSCQSAQVLIGPRSSPRYAGLVGPGNYGQKISSRTFVKSSEMEDVTIYLPRNEIIADLELSFPEDAQVEKPTPYEWKPFVAYGSSITEGGCCCNLFNSYTALLSSRLNIDYYNLGFSGSAKGELAMADYINTFDMSVFIYDYDHNAPTPAFLLNTHEPFFLRIREKHPDLPVIMMSKPAEVYTGEDVQRREIILQTYRKALARGDRNVYFIDGETFYGAEERHLCSIDGCHPNDLGFYRMANTIEVILRSILHGKNV